jgi:hypothetical protein
MKQTNKNNKSLGVLDSIEHTIFKITPIRLKDKKKRDRTFKMQKKGNAVVF